MCPRSRLAPVLADTPGGRSRQHRAIARLTAYRFDGKGFDGRTGAALKALHVDPEALAAAAMAVLPTRGVHATAPGVRRVATLQGVQSWESPDGPTVAELESPRRRPRDMSTGHERRSGTASQTSLPSPRVSPTRNLSSSSRISAVPRAAPSSGTLTCTDLDGKSARRRQIDAKHLTASLSGNAVNVTLKVSNATVAPGVYGGWVKENGTPIVQVVCSVS